MLYREAGQVKTSYEADQAIFPIAQDRVAFAAVLAAAYLVVPFIASDYALLTILIPFLVFALAAIGLNILAGYAGQLSLGTGGFMAVGAFATYKPATSFPGLHHFIVFFLARLIAPPRRRVFRLPPPRIKRFYFPGAP